MGFAVFSSDVFQRSLIARDRNKPNFELNWANKQFTTLFETSTTSLNEALNIILLSEIDNGPQPLAFPENYSIMKILKDFVDVTIRKNSKVPESQTKLYQLCKHDV